MSTSSAQPPSSPQPQAELLRWRTHLDTLIAADDTAMVPPTDQVAIEHAIASGIALLASEPLPEPEPPDSPSNESRSNESPSNESPSNREAGESSRPILAKDLRITTDLVLRALATHQHD